MISIILAVLGGIALGVGGMFVWVLWVFRDWEI